LAAAVLDELNWQPVAYEAEAAYRAARCEWDRCAAIGAPAVGRLCALLHDGDKGVRRAAAETLDRLSWRPGTPEGEAVYRIARCEWDRCVAIGTPAVSPLCTVLQDGDMSVRQGAAEALGWIGDVRAAAPLCAAARGGQSRAVIDVVSWALARIGAPAVEPLCAALADGDKHVRLTAARSLLAIYQSGKLDQAQRLRILGYRSAITQRHEDGRFGCSGQGPHTDKGIGMQFPE
jgi:hypothetical protein